MPTSPVPTSTPIPTTPLPPLSSTAPTALPPTSYLDPVMAHELAELEKCVARDIAEVHRTHNESAEPIVKALQTASNRHYAQFTARSKHYIKESQRLQKDLSALHRLNDTQYRDSLARLTRQSQEQLHPATSTRDTSLRQIREGKVQKQKLIRDRHLERKQLWAQKQRRLQAIEAQNQAKAAHEQQRLLTQQRILREESARLQRVEARRLAFQQILEDAQQARLRDEQRIRQAESVRLQNQEIQRLAFQRALEAARQARIRDEQVRAEQAQLHLQEIEARRQALQTERMQASQRIEEARLQARLQRRQQVEARRLAAQRNKNERRLARLQRAEARRRPRAEYLQQYPLLAEFRVTAAGEEMPRLAVATVGPVCMSLEEARAVERLRGTWVDNNTSRTISSDGALIKSGTAGIAMAFGVADLSQPELLTVKGRTDGYASSAKAELMGLLAATLSAPPDQNIMVELDNESVVDQYQHLVKDRRSALPRKRLRSNYAGLWAVLHQVVEDRAGTTEVQWVRGHGDNEGNIMADRVATYAARQTTVPWSVDLGAQQDIQHFARFQSQLVETDLRQILKQQSVIRHHQSWTTQRRVKSGVKDLHDVEWRSTLAHIHNKCSVHSFYSSAKETHQRTHRIKTLHGMLPTLNSMHARHPNLYPHCICRGCELEEEDNRHLWSCTALDDVNTAIWNTALTRIDGWGRAATTKYNRVHEEKQVEWTSPTSSTNIQGLSSIIGARAILLGEGVPDCHPHPTWTVADLYRGITPLSLMQDWGRLFDTPMSIAQSVIHKFVGYLAAQATELIWKPRCTATISWEREQGITPAQKKAVYNGPRRDWSAGYGFKFGPDHCPCSHLLADHHNGHCPGPVRDPLAADYKLLECWLGKQHRSTMEGVGRIPFL